VSDVGSDRRLGLKLALLTAAMFGFGFALVPLYDVFCDVTGFGGKTSGVPETFVGEVDENRSVRVEFVASLGQIAPWEFHPAVSSMVVHPGALNDATFFARNLTDRHVVGQAVPSISPGEAAEHFKKIECFCFTQQEFEPNEARDMGVSFTVSPDLPDYIDTLTLSYTFYAVDK
jgi:cytochrome c oxidase assembly protein subunit 11